MLQDSAVVLRSEAIAEGRCPGFAASKIIAHNNNHNDDYRYRNEELAFAS
jgi:hypothetical protein